MTNRWWVDDKHDIRYVLEPCDGARHLWDGPYDDCEAAAEARRDICSSAHPHTHVVSP